MGGRVGYAHLIDAMALQAIEVKQPALIQPVTRIERIGGALSVPQAVAPEAGDFLAHIMFALKHEGVNLAILAQALPRLDGQLLVDAISQAPSSAYIRKICFLWEMFCNQQLDYPDNPRGPATFLFDPARYITGPSLRNNRWRVDFNGLGTLKYCITVERTPELQALLDYDILGRSRAFIASLPKEMMDRAINWAYLSETESSFAIEKEAPSEQKAQRFIQLLRQAHDRQPLTENYLVALQNSAISNPLDRAAAFRHEQNHLSNALRGSAGVTYVPPPPDLCRELMVELMAFANQAPLQLDPLVAAGIASFGFVFIRPFMDGNGRLSRFLIHQTLCCSGALENGLLLPVSVAMKREEQRYLEALQSFSKPARQFWDVRWIDADSMSFDFTGDPSLYQYWDATDCVTFTMEMAKRALEVELREETLFLQRYDTLIKVVNASYDVRGSLLSKLVMQCMDQNGVVSKGRRKQYLGLIQEEVFDFLEAHAQALLAKADTEPHGEDE
ncbi:Fic family protein [Pseudomonas rubra]|uniref:Fic family protein n=1 Tax=Pseudomonas rubra TaxID=2942627 RepID=A0ABT5P2K6_9PSED|nr:Fic family protein [Pseudomonas rubra]MDD1012506.1 Fic family protein [Pseudomonas rubra]MDD1041617.1 Fic family protein [Pseudomonas rubra]MDD1157992.1 Fic family protein [Pseudomonas rubra]